MRVLIIEDELRATQKLSRLLSQIDPPIEIIGNLPSVEKATNWFQNNNHPELVFMDIQLEDGLSFEIFENCDIKAPVIFTTAFDEYTLKAFKVNSVDYLLKPIVFDELKKAIDKFKSIHNRKPEHLQLEAIINRLKPNTKERFLIKIGEHYRSIQTANISCFYVKERYNFIYTDEGRNYPVEYSLDKIEKLVDQKKFFRINRSYIVNFSAIKDVIAYSSSRLKIKLTNWQETDELLVSRNRVSEFKEWMDR